MRQGLHGVWPFKSDFFYLGIIQVLDRRLLKLQQHFFLLSSRLLYIHLH
jgi:hypothetical protein